MLKWLKNFKGIHAPADLPAQWILDNRVPYKSRSEMFSWPEEEKVLGGARSPNNKGSEGSIPVLEAI